MKRLNKFVLGLCVAAATAACAGDREPDSSAPADPAAVGTAGSAEPAREAAAGAAASADSDFVGEMMADSRAEIVLGKLAQEKARNPQVKNFAAMMVRDHTAAGKELKTVATQAKLDMTGHDANMDHHKELRERLGTLSGAEFDREYINAMVDDHEKAVREAEDRAEGAGSEHIKGWAAKSLPTLRKHLEQARQIQDALDRKTGN